MIILECSLCQLSAKEIELLNVFPPYILKDNIQ